MDTESARLFVPFLGMMLLTLVVWLYMYARRLTWIAANQPDNDLLGSPEKLNALIPEAVNRPSNNLKNLFELPVLFYALCLFLAFAGQVDGVHVACAWGFFLFRAVHSGIHCTVNRVPLRFAAYALAAAFLWVMVIRAALGHFGA